MSLLGHDTLVSPGVPIYALAGSGGGGGAGPNLLVSTLVVSGSSPADGSSLSLGGLVTSGALLNYTDSGLTYGQIQFKKNLGNLTTTGGVQINAGQTADVILVGNNAIQLNSPLTTVNQLIVSSINGGPVNRSTIGSVSCPANASTLITSMPEGLFAYSLFCQNATQDAVVNGFFNITTDTNTSTKYPSLSANFNGGGNGGNVFPYIDVSVPSNPRLGLANTSINIFATVGTINRIA